MKKLKSVILIAALCLAKSITAQETGIIKGTLTDEKGKNMPFVTVALMEDSTIVNGANTDDNGDFTFKLLTPGLYNLRFSFVGYQTILVRDVEVRTNKTSYVYKGMTLQSYTLGGGEVFADKWDKPVIDQEFSTMTLIDIDQIEEMAVEKGDVIGIIVNVTPGVLPSDDGKDIYMRGSRTGSTAYYIDGNRIIGSPEVPGIAIQSMEVLTGGVPAEYGDCTGGLVIITTKDYKFGMKRKQIKKTEREDNGE